MTATTERTGWTGWIVFAGIMLIVGGVLNAIYGLVAVLNDEWVVWGNRGAVYLDVTGWGWIHFLLGIVVVFAGIGVMTGNVIARTIGVFVAALSMLVNFLALPLYPLWSITLITVDVLVIWALIAHGSEMREA
jgi:hypothetical protein